MRPFIVNGIKTKFLQEIYLYLFNICTPTHFIHKGLKSVHVASIFVYFRHCHIAIYRVYDDPENKGSVLLKEVRTPTTLNTRDVYEWLKIGLQERQTAATNLNRESSRSHTLFTIQVNIIESVNGGHLIKAGKLHLVDLAGSENVGRSGATEQRAREAGTINKSLLTIGKVIKALVQKAPHVPYR